MKRSLFFAAAALALVAAPAFAADLPVKARPAAVAAVYNWTGWYVGGNIGYGWGGDTGGLWDSFVDTTPLAVGFGPYFAAGGNVLPGTRPSGVIGGAQVGYNWQLPSNLVFGVVADLQGSDMHDSASVTVNPNGAITVQTNSSRIDWFGTVRGRAGFAANNWLFYGTGGLAYGNVKSNLTFTCTTCGVLAYAGSNSSTQVGWTAGAGIEVGLSPNWTAGVEYLHFDLGSILTTALPVGTTIPATSISANSKFTGDIVRATLNYRFSPAIVAKY